MCKGLSVFFHTFIVCRCMSDGWMLEAHGNFANSVYSDDVGNFIGCRLGPLSYRPFSVWAKLAKRWPDGFSWKYSEPQKYMRASACQIELQTQAPQYVFHHLGKKTPLLLWGWMTWSRHLRYSMCIWLSDSKFNPTGDFI